MESIASCHVFVGFPLRGWLPRDAKKSIKIRGRNQIKPGQQWNWSRGRSVAVPKLIRMLLLLAKPGHLHSILNPGPHDSGTSVSIIYRLHWRYSIRAIHLHANAAQTSWMTDWLSETYRSHPFGRTNMFRLMPELCSDNRQTPTHPPRTTTAPCCSALLCQSQRSDTFIATNLFPFNLVQP